MTTSILVLAEERYRKQAQPAGLVRALEEAGADVRLVDDSELPVQPASADVVVARGRSEAVMETLRAAENAGVPTVDPAHAVAAVRDKAIMTTRLKQTGLPMPRTWVGTGSELHRELSELLEPEHPTDLIVKPVLGDNSRGVRPRPRLSELPAMDEPGGLLLQELIPGSGADLKLYVIGERVWATRKPSPVMECHAQDLGPVRVTEEMRRIARVCREEFGLSLFGVDCVERTNIDGTVTGAVVIEVNDFPNYTAVPDADRHLARHVLAFASTKFARDRTVQARRSPLRAATGRATR